MANLAVGMGDGPFRELAERRVEEMPCTRCGKLCASSELLFATDGSLHCIACDRPAKLYDPTARPDPLLAGLAIGVVYLLMHFFL